MPLLARTIHTPLAIEIRQSAVAGLAEILADHRISPSGNIAIAVGPGLGSEVSDMLRPLVSHAEIFTLAAGSLDAAIEFGSKLRAGHFDAVAAIGGGKVIDTVKYAASVQGLPMVAVATSLAHDGLASPVSVLERDGVSVSYGVHTPIAVLVDLDFVRRSPARHTRSGIGDALSNLSAIADWQLANAVNGEPVDGLASVLAATSASALLNHPGSLQDDGFLAALANALILGGLAMAVAGSSRPCSGGCHEISHAIDHLYPGRGTHGEQAGIGALFCTLLRGDEVLFSGLLNTFRRHGLPVRPADIGLTDAEFSEAVLYAPSTRPGRYTILEHRELSPAAAGREVADFCARLG